MRAWPSRSLIRARVQRTAGERHELLPGLLVGVMQPLRKKSIPDFGGCISTEEVETMQVFQKQLIDVKGGVA
jgi:hypothetical protein